MTTVTWGLICGFAIGLIDVLVMIPLKFESQRHRIEAMAGAFLERFMMGFLIPNLSLSVSTIVLGAILGVGLSLPTAIITRTYLPIVGFGLVSGLLVGGITTIVL